MFITRSIFTSLTTIPDDMYANPEQVKVFKGIDGNASFIHFRTDKYYFIWTAESLSDSTIEIRQRAGCVTYKIHGGVPYEESYSEYTDPLSQTQQEQAAIALKFILEAVKQTLKPVA